VRQATVCPHGTYTLPIDPGLKVAGMSKCHTGGRLHGHISERSSERRRDLDSLGWDTWNREQEAGKYGCVQDRTVSWSMRCAQEKWPVGIQPKNVTYSLNLYSLRIFSMLLI